MYCKMKIEKYYEIDYIHKQLLILFKMSNKWGSQHNRVESYYCFLNVIIQIVKIQIHFFSLIQLS
jgi:hypothetical protein